MTTYEDAGVDIAKGEEAVQRIKKHVESTFTKNVLRGVGSYAGAMDIDEEPNVLLATVDGVGTKTLIAAVANKWEGIGHDIVNHCANDLVCQGARPLCFLDYVAASSLDPATIETIVKGMSDACKELGCEIGRAHV